MTERSPMRRGGTSYETAIALIDKIAARDTADGMPDKHVVFLTDDAIETSEAKTAGQLAAEEGYREIVAGLRDGSTVLIDKSGAY